MGELLCEAEATSVLSRLSDPAITTLIFIKHWTSLWHADAMRLGLEYFEPSAVASMSLPAGWKLAFMDQDRASVAGKSQDTFICAGSSLDG
jgi:hypothetical protein